MPARGFQCMICIQTSRKCKAVRKDHPERVLIHLLWPHITAFKSQTPPVPQTQIWVLMWWNKSYWIAAEMCILSQHLTPCVHNHRRFHKELIANYHMAQREGCSETIRPFETFRERTDMQFAVFSVSKIIWGLRSVCREKQHSVFQVQEHCHNLPVLKWKKNSASSN